MQSGRSPSTGRSCWIRLIMISVGWSITETTTPMVSLILTFSPDAQAPQVPENFRDLRVVNRRFIEAAHARNLRVQVWTVNDVNAMQRLLNLGVDGIMTDYPQRLLEVLKK